MRLTSITVNDFFHPAKLLPGIDVGDLVNRFAVTFEMNHKAVGLKRFLLLPADMIKAVQFVDFGKD